MIERIFLGAIALGGIFAASDGLVISNVEGDTPTEVSPMDLQKNKENAARFVRAPGIVVAMTVCNESWFEDESKEKTGSTFENYTPILSEGQITKLIEGNRVTTNAVAVFPNCDPVPETIDIVGVRNSGLEDIGEELRGKFATENIIISKDAVIINQGERPPSNANNLLVLIISIIALLCSIVPFFNKEKWPTVNDLDHKSDIESLDAMFPILKSYKSLRTQSLAGINLLMSDSREDVLFKLNCESNHRPCLMVVTDRRLILFRVKFQLGLRILATIEQLLDKVPVVGGMAAILVQPFTDTYRMFTAKDTKIYRETMGYDNSELLSGEVPWKKQFDIAWQELAARYQEVAAKKGFWSGKLKIEFVPRKLTHVFRKTPDVTVNQDVVLRALAIMARTAAPFIEKFGGQVDSTKDRVVVKFEDVAI